MAEIRLDPHFLFSLFGDKPLLACSKCFYPLPNNLLHAVDEGTINPCPNCGSVGLVDNPFNILTYSKIQNYSGRFRLTLGFDFVKAIPYQGLKERNIPSIEIIPLGMVR